MSEVSKKMDSKLYPDAPNNKTAKTDYVYYVQFDGDRIRHLTKVWNDAIALKQLGWA